MLSEGAPYYPVGDSFARQQVHERTGISDDVLGFWMKRGLIIPLPAKPRAHRRFSYEQLHIAAVLNSMHSLGANISVLRKFADALQSGARLFHKSPFNRSQLHSAARLRLQLERFAQGAAGTVYNPAVLVEDEEPATSEEDVVLSWLAQDEVEGATPALGKFAKSLTVDEANALGWTLSLLDPFHLTHAGEIHGSRWVAWLDNDGRPRFADPNEVILESEDGPLAAFYIPVSKLISSLWPERLEMARNADEEERKARLSERVKTNPYLASLHPELAQLDEEQLPSTKEGKMDG